MMKRAFEGTEFAGLDEFLEGPSAIAISKEDATAPARILCKFAKEADKLELKAGVVEGTVYDVAGLTELCKDSFKRSTSFQIAWKLCSHLLQIFARVINQIAEQGGAAGAAAEATSRRS